jgi:uncharacterized membrane protein YgcG
MRPGLADFSPTVAATFAVGIGISLSVFLLPAGVVQEGPTAVLPAFGGAAGRVVADLPVAAGGHASEARKAASAHPQIVVARRVHRARTGVARRAPSVPVRAVAPAAPKIPVTKSRLFSMPPTAKGKARGHARGHGPKPKAATPAPLPRGRGKALGRSNEHQDSLPPGLAKKAPPGSPPGLAARPKGNGGGSEGKGNGRGNGGKGNGGGNGGKGNGGGNGRKWEEK